MEENIGIYVHVPFCKSKCSYCNFYSVTKTHSMNDYAKAVCREMGKYKSDLTGRKVSTVYFGGGTPSLLGSEHLSGILEHLKNTFDVLDDAEISLEANPNSVDLQMLRELVQSGFNRISLGAQSANEYELKLLGRTHSNKQVAQAVFWAREAGFDTISLDLMIGVPSQTPDSLDRSIDFVCSLGVDHISAYILKLEEGTPLHKGRYVIDIPDDDLQADYYSQTVSRLEEKGYKQYEISNFCKNGRRCKHNMIYWDGKEYLGLGSSAHSFIGDDRFYYDNDLDSFIKNSHDHIKHTKTSSTGGDIEEYLMLRLRLNDGIIYNEVEKRFYFPIEYKSKIEKKAVELAKHDLCEFDSDGIRLTSKGFLLSNYCTSFLLGIYSD